MDMAAAADEVPPCESLMGGPETKRIVAEGARAAAEERAKTAALGTWVMGPWTGTPMDMPQPAPGMPELVVGDEVHHFRTLRQGKVIGIDIGVDIGANGERLDNIDIEFDEFQKPGVIYQDVVQLAYMADGKTNTGRRRSAFVKGPNKLVHWTSYDQEEHWTDVSERHYRYAGRFDDPDSDDAGKGKGKDAGKGKASWKGQGPT